MGKLARKFQVPDEIANLYEFANSLDLRCFTHNCVQHAAGDELATAQGLVLWMSARGLVKGETKITQPMFEIAIQLRTALRAFIECDPAERLTNKNVLRSVNKAINHFPLVIEAGIQGEMKLCSVRNDALGGLSNIVAELYDTSANGFLNRLKMCAAEECKRVFYDRSKPGTRRWCMSTLCGNRMKARAYRERLRGVPQNSRAFVP